MAIKAINWYMNIPHGIVVSLQTFIQVKSMVCGLYPKDTTAHMNLYASHQFLGVGFRFVFNNPHPWFKGLFRGLVLGCGLEGGFKVSFGWVSLESV